ncbi:MAG: calcium/sodium antiporter [Myxococcota bacterium]
MILALELACGLLGLLVGADLAIRGASAIGYRFGLTPLVVGLTIVAWGTSLPELVVSTRASLAGFDEIALGNVVGSNISNLLLILGVSALVRAIAVDARVLTIEAPILVATTLAIAALLWVDALGRLVGALLVATLLAHTTWTIRSTRRVEGGGAGAARSDSDGHDAGVGAESTDTDPAAQTPWRDVLRTALGLAMLTGGGSLFVEGASGAAEALGIPPAIVGLTLVAVGTSLPELAASTIAALRGQGDLAIGNVLGSNVFNLVGVLGVAATADPLERSGLAGRDLVALVVSTLALTVLLYTRGRLERWEGAVLLVGYGVYLATLRI